MIELWLNFKDEKGEDQRVLVDSEKFTIGRHSTNDLVIPNSRLSREHIKIDRFADIFVVSECGSSNGSSINGQDLKDPVVVKNGDEINLGGGVDLRVETVSDDPNAAPPGADGSGSDDGAGEDEASGAASAAAAGNSAGSASSAGGESGIPTIVFYLAPIFGVIILIFLGGIIYLASSGDSTKAKDDEFVYSTNKDKTNPDNDRPTKKRDDPPANQSGTDNPPPSNSGPPVNADPNTSPPPTINLTDSAKCEQNGGAFLRQIAQNDPKAFLTGEQAQLVNAKIKQLSSTSAIADNINSARKSSSQIKAIAVQKNLKPQLLAAAAITALGTTRGDVLQKAQGMADTLDKLGTQIGNELASDSLLMIAAYDQGAKGDFMSMRNMLQDIATKSTESSREVRTIWFLHKNGKISDGEYNFAIQFVAIGTIAQNPKDFGVNTDSLVL